jgi:putative DNA primase/helicase
MLASFIHFCIADDLIDNEKARKGQIRYLTLQNGLYDLSKYELKPHSPKIFTTNLLPYDFDPGATCQRFLQYLDEVFIGDKDVINFVQEAVGYAFHKAIPIPAIFFLIGIGSNGKSVFIDTLTNLCGSENACSISLNSLSKEYYILDLFEKMINISSETPHKKMINTDVVKAVVAGDWVTGRKPYKGPSKFKPFAKHYLAMNDYPLIDDASHGMWRRIYIINFPKKFAEKEMDVHLTEKLKMELSGIFNWAIEGYKRLRERDFKFSEGKSMRESKQQYKDQSNSALNFASQYLEISDPEDSIKLKDLYKLGSSPN